ncbi:MAG: insulinase family protein [Methylococcales bacterium]|nr:insulinase family protein [Methylococcales bacterium]
MRINFIGLLFLLFSQSSFSAAKIEQWKTSQGTPVFYIEATGLPMVDIQVVFDAGSARDDHQKGIAALTSLLLDTGAGAWNADEIAQRFESVGAQFGTSVSRDNASVSLRSLTDPKLLNKALLTMQTILSQPTFNKNDFQREKNRTLAGLKHREESPGAIASIEFFKAIYKNHPYAHPTEGNIETVSGFSEDDIKSFYTQYYVSKNAMVVIVGDMDKQQAMATAESLVSNLSSGNAPSALPEVNLVSKGSNKHIEFPSTQTHVLAGLIGMDRKDPNYFDFYVGNHILGGSGLVSQLFKEVREKKGLAYSASSHFSPMLKKGPFTMGLQTRNNQTKQAVDVMQKTLRNFVSHGPTEEELIAAKKNITGGFAIRFDTNSKLTSYVAMIGFYKLPLDYLDAFQKKVEAITVSSIKNAFQKRIKPENIHTITVGGKN